MIIYPRRWILVFVCAAILSAHSCIVSAESDDGPVYGEIAVSSEPNGAEIYIDGVSTGKLTNRRILGIIPGIHSVKVTLPGYRDAEINVLVTAGERAFAHLDLKQKVGSLAVLTTPEGAKIYIDGLYKGKSNTIIKEIPEGHHSVSLNLDGYQPGLYSMDVEDGDTLHLSHEFELLPTTGTVVVNCSPDEASVYLDDEYYGLSEMTLEAVEPGSHTLRLTKYGYHNWSSPFEIQAGEIRVFNHALEGKNGTISVLASPSEGEIFLDGRLLGTGSYQGEFPQGTYLMEVKAPGFDLYQKAVEVPYDPIHFDVPLSPLAPALIVEAESKIEENRAFNPEGAEMELKVARALLSDEDYYGAYLAASNASCWAEDVDGDGVPNSLDFWHAMQNDMLYASPLVLLIMVGSVIGFDWKRCRVRPNVELWSNLQEDGSQSLHVETAAGNKKYRTLLCTVYLDGVPVERIVGPGKKTVNIGSLSSGSHIARAVVEVQQLRYGLSECSKELEIAIE
ncbi:PEGA domain-containing protein [Methanoculleus sp. FWC-SCC1]|uniref:PEGA domain-containing protein n=1 Tax=Methanoculleus frigidifontis TaxID=2584085 RepID=A0ABT8MDK2_9EURY|nr:PEGA domain-containing protein [Methanoculleus sp. FWC-SCC1]MDN7026020.1 PEGA domain-containing protein [Methanoculleus sp. FWC-SCC1]